MSHSIVPYACLHIDMPCAQLLRVLAACLLPSDRAADQRAIEQLWGVEHILVTLCARTAFDLFLQESHFPPGAEILMTAINIPDMSFIIRHHGLVPVPIDVDVNTLAPQMAALERAVSSRAVAVLCAHIYGRRWDMEPVVAFARRHRLQVVEDCAEAFDGLAYRGHAASDLVLFSFGTIKLCTAFGGGVARVRDSCLFRRMEQRHQQYAVQSRAAFFTKVLKVSGVQLVLNCPAVTWLVMRLGRATRCDHKVAVVGLVRGFPDQLIARMRRRPCSPLLAALRCRLADQPRTAARLARQHAVCERMLVELPAAAVVPGRQAPHRGHWLFPVMVAHPARVIAMLNERGVDAYRGATQLALVQAAREREVPGEDPAHARFLMEHVVYLPVHQLVPLRQLLRIAKEVREVLQETGPLALPACKL